MQENNYTIFTEVNIDNTYMYSTLRNQGLCLQLRNSRFQCSQEWSSYLILHVSRDHRMMSKSSFLTCKLCVSASYFIATEAAFEMFVPMLMHRDGCLSCN